MRGLEFETTDNSVGLRSLDLAAKFLTAHPNVWNALVAGAANELFAFESHQFSRPAA